MKNILVAVDEPKEADQLTAQAVKFANLTNAKIWIIHVTESDADEYLAREAGPQSIIKQKAEERKKQAACIRQWADDVVNNNNLEAEGLLIEGQVIKSIKQIVEDHNIDLVVAGHKKKNFLYELFTGNKKRDLIDELKVPLLAVPLG